MNFIVENIYQLPVLIGGIFILTSFITKIFAPKKRNAFYGYRTPRSMKNQETWDFAQNYSTTKMVQVGFFLIVFSLLKFILGSFYENFFIFSAVIGATIFIFFATEKAIQKKFPDNVD